MLTDNSLFSLPAPELAPALLGKLLCRKDSAGTVTKLRITETEAYFGEEDTACHAHRGRTPRTEMLYREGGCAYVYLCYGIHSLLNVVSGEAGHPEAVLIRGVEGFTGPGRVTKRLGITREQNGVSLFPDSGLWIEDDGTEIAYIKAPRVGIDYASPCDRDKLWRFIVRIEQ